MSDVKLENKVKVDSDPFGCQCSCQVRISYINWRALAMRHSTHFENISDISLKVTFWSFILFSQPTSPGILLFRILFEKIFNSTLNLSFR